MSQTLAVEVCVIGDEESAPRGLNTPPPPHHAAHLEGPHFGAPPLASLGSVVLPNPFVIIQQS